MGLNNNKKNTLTITRNASSTFRFICNIKNEEIEITLNK